MVDANKNPDPDVYIIDQSTVEFNCVGVKEVLLDAILDAMQ